ncbi:MAG TPA: carboxypeptidase-like regulatory domain-containing protein, partial [Solirubrobacteraceae bacterium]|nr:carboxypeptidase-like regulatory domain-containing protein [Solirubrobacteraceae bacterium]
AVVYLYAADLTLEQNTQPLVENVTGELATATTLSGTADLSFAAFDPGSGIYQAVFTLDGVESGRTLIDENGGHCRDLGGTGDGLPAFLYLQPCASSVSADVPFDTTGLSDGAHHLVVAVTDAAGNSTVVLDRKIDVANHPSQLLPGAGQGASGVAGQVTLGAGQGTATLGPAANGTPASAAASLSAHWSSGAHTALTARFGSAHTVSGRLLAPGGTPIAGAQVQALFQPGVLGAPTRKLATAYTGADGGFTLRLVSSLQSGRLTLAYSSRTGQASPNVTAALTLNVRASLSLQVAPRVSHAGGTIRFTGDLHGGPLPRGGKQLVLEARVPGGAWRQFRVLASGPHGRYRASYRFRLPGPVTYQFRASCPHEADFPFASGSSNVVSVRER